MVHRSRLNPPAAAQLEPAPWLVGKGRDRDAVLKRDWAPADRFQAQRRRQLGGCLGADACRQKEPECDVNQDEAGEPAGRAQPPALSRAEASALEQASDGVATVELEGGARRPPAFGGVEAP